MILNDGITTIELNDDLRWIDEFGFSPITQNIERTISGAQVIQEGVLIKGRPITLSGGVGVWMPKSVLNQLYDMAMQPNVTATLTMADGRVFKVTFNRNGTESPIRGEPVHRQTIESDATMYENITLKLMEIA